MAELAIINGYDIRDRKLADATTKTGVDSSDSIVLKTTSGYANILKEDFTKAVRSVMGGLLSDLDKGTSIDSVACLGSGNHDFGSISTANLASVLGVEKLFSMGSRNYHFTYYNYGEDVVGWKRIFNFKYSRCFGFLLYVSAPWYNDWDGNCLMFIYSGDG